MGSLNCFLVWNTSILDKSSLIYSTNVYTGKKEGAPSQWAYVCRRLQAVQPVDFKLRQVRTFLWVLEGLLCSTTSTETCSEQSCAVRPIHSCTQTSRQLWQYPWEVSTGTCNFVRRYFSTPRSLLCTDYVPGSTRSKINLYSWATSTYWKDQKGRCRQNEIDLWILRR